MTATLQELKVFRSPLSPQQVSHLASGASEYALASPVVWHGMHPTVTTAAPTCRDYPQGWVNTTGGGCATQTCARRAPNADHSHQNYFRTGCKTWQQARAQCAAAGGDLVVIQTSAKLRSVQAYRDSFTDYSTCGQGQADVWVGAAGCGGSGCGWVDGSAWSFAGFGFNPSEAAGPAYLRLNHLLSTEAANWGGGAVADLGMGVCEKVAAPEHHGDGFYTFGGAIGTDTWKLVRRVQAGSQWHPATDRLSGTQAYGRYSPDLRSNSTFGVRFDDMSCDQILFSTGDMQQWLIAAKTAVAGTYSGTARSVVRSSEVRSAYTAIWYNRATVLSDPLISLGNYPSRVVYAGDNHAGVHALPLSNDGANVFCRITPTSATGVLLDLKGAYTKNSAGAVRYSAELENGYKPVDGVGLGAAARPWASCGHSNLATNPWWGVDLGETKWITKVKLYGRDSFQTRLHNAKVCRSPLNT
jgi:hypothetical protein